MHRASALAALAAALLLGMMASTAAAAPIVSHFHDNFSGMNAEDEQCGIEGSSVFSGVVNVQEFAAGTFQSEVSFRYVFTSAATGKSVEISGAHYGTGATTDNGDGTVTFVSTFKGLAQKLKIPNGPTLTLDAGYVTIYETFDTATGKLISRTISPEHGPHPALDSGTLFCDVIVAALT